MSVDRARIARLIISTKNVNAVTLNPSDSDQVRQNVAKKMIEGIVRKSNQRSIVLIAIEM